MQASLRVGDEENLRSLYDWLMDDRPLRRGVQMELGCSRPPDPGRQGPVFDLVSLILGSGFNAASLGVAIASWRASRPTAPSVLVERPDGTRVTISGASPQEEQRLLHELLDDQL